MANFQLIIMFSSLPASQLVNRSVLPLLMLYCGGTGHLEGSRARWTLPASSTNLKVKEIINWEICFYELLLSLILTIKHPTKIFHSPIMCIITLCNVPGIQRCLPRGWQPGGVYLGWRLFLKKACGREELACTDDRSSWSRSITALHGILFYCYNPMR